MEDYKLTGRSFTPAEYKDFTKCVVCGIVVKDTCKSNGCGDTDSPCPSHYCEPHKVLVLNKCRICEGVIHSEPIKSFTYDIKEFKRWDGFEFKVSKVQIQEFVYHKEPSTVQSSVAYECRSCQGYKKKIKNTCYTCGSAFENDRDNYIKNGNMCEYCVFGFDLKERTRLVSLEII